jgi:hypothetical protein
VLVGSSQSLVDVTGIPPGDEPENDNDGFKPPLDDDAGVVVIALGGGRLRFRIPVVAALDDDVVVSIAPTVTRLLLELFREEFCDENPYFLFLPPLEGFELLDDASGGGIEDGTPTAELELDDADITNLDSTDAIGGTSEEEGEEEDDIVTLLNVVNPHLANTACNDTLAVEVEEDEDGNEDAFGRGDGRPEGIRCKPRINPSLV